MRDAALVIHFIGLAMGVGASFGLFFLAMASSKMEQSERKKFMLRAFNLIKMGYLGITLLILSGVYLLSLDWGHILHCLLFQIKVALVVVLLGLILSIGSKVKKIRTGDASASMKQVQIRGRLALLSGIIIIILAVMVFH